jgi:phenylalanyl-tRNA synthetase beta chain
MRVPVSWLRSFVDVPDDLDLLVATLDDLGLVVEGTEVIGEGLEDVVVVRVEQIAAIEGADRIRLATVTDGETSTEVVCGAWNYEVGSLVPLAPVGATLPGGFEIARRKMRGVFSNGMLCSGRELGIGEDHEGLLILDDVAGAVPGRRVLDVYGIEPDVVLDITVEGNRPDAWCVEGIARDLAARFDVALRSVEPAPIVGSGAATPVLASVEIRDPDLCGRFTVTVLGDVEVGPSPAWVARRLELAGMRSINNVVDASNYVMLELGQPTHPYDLDRVGGRGFIVRRAVHGERLSLLDGSELGLAEGTGALGDTGEDLVICDALDVPIGLAGVMGGSTTEIADDTRTVALEAAWFEPMAVARSAKRHKLRTEASARFERGCDPMLATRAAARFAEILRESVPGMVVAPEPIDARGAIPTPPVLDITPGALARTLGVELDLGEIARLLAAIGFDVRESADGLRVVAPSGRPDLREAPFGVADVAEEVGRLHGYAALPRRIPTWAAPGGLAPQVAQRRVLREALVGLGALEAWTPTMVAGSDAALLGDDRRHAKVTNPITAEEPYLRASLLPGLLGAVRRNVERRQGDVAMFEVGVVFEHPSVASSPRLERGGSGGADLVEVPGEDERVALVLARPGDDARTAVAAWQAIAAALRLDHVLLTTPDARAVPHGVHATRCAILVDASSGATLGVVGEVDPGVVERAVPGLGPDRRIGWVDCSISVLSDPALATRRPDGAVVPSRFPSSDVDLALIVDDAIGVDRVKATLREAAGDLCESVACFDAYRGPGVPEGSRSLAVRVRLCAQDRTLSDAELTAARAAMISAAETQVSATLR